MAQASCSTAAIAGKVAGRSPGLRDAGFTAHASVFDVTDLRAVDADVARIEAEIGPIDILDQQCRRAVPRAARGFSRGASGSGCCKTNVSGAFHAGKAVARSMIARGKGKIINIGSVQSELARPNIAPYTATKGAIRNLTRGMCTDWAKYGLQINAIAPGYFRTEMNQALVDNRNSPPGWKSARRPAAGAMSTSWSAPPCSWPPTPRPSSTATRSMSTAA